jgi:hypothetical protein
MSEQGFKDWMTISAIRENNGMPYSQNTIPQYLSYIRTMPDFIKKELNIAQNDFFVISSKEEAEESFGRFDSEIAPSLRKIDKKKVDDFSSAFRLYIRFLKETSLQIADDLKFIIEDKNIEVTEKVQSILARIGQGQFRDDLINIWKGCSVTGYDDCSLLIASHIKPWSVCKENRLNPYNGLLLTPNLDKAFDKGLITFEKDGKIRISKLLKNSDSLGIKKEMMVELKPENESFMEYHRSNKYKDE